VRPTETERVASRQSRVARPVCGGRRLARVLFCGDGRPARPNTEFVGAGVSPALCGRDGRTHNGRTHNGRTHGRSH